MKLSSKILLAMGALLLAGMLSSNLIMKKEYDKVDNNDRYWTFKKIEKRPFKYLKIKGGNITHIAFEQSKDCSVRISEDWQRYHGGSVKTTIRNDTLYIDFDFVPRDLFEKNWMKNTTVVRVFAPELKSVEGANTNFEMYKMKQNIFAINLIGKSFLEVESMMPNFDSLNVVLKDSTQVVFEMSPEYKQVARNRNVTDGNNSGTADESLIRNKEAMTLRSLVADIQGMSLLDVGHAQIKKIKLSITDSSAIILSGSSLKKLRQ